MSNKQTNHSEKPTNGLARVAKYLAAAGIAIPLAYCVYVIAAVAGGAEFSSKEMLQNAGAAFAVLEGTALFVWIATKLGQPKSK